MDVSTALFPTAKKPHYTRPCLQNVCLFRFLHVAKNVVDGYTFSQSCSGKHPVFDSCSPVDYLGGVGTSLMHSSLEVHQL